MIFAKKSLGQNFLIHSAVSSRIVAQLAPTEETSIVEIGPGHGALTNLLCTLPHKYLLLLEKDHLLAQERQRHLPASAQCIETDARTFPYERLDSSWQIIGNLPYNIASPLIWDIVATSSVELAVFMVQKEVAERICAHPCSKEYGALSIWVQSFMEPTLAFVVGRDSFRPRPKIESAVVRLCAKKDPLDPSLQPALKALLHLSFQQRRKQLLGICTRANLPSAASFFAHEGILPTARPEELTVQTFMRMAAFLKKELLAAESKK